MIERLLVIKFNNLGWKGCRPLKKEGGAAPPVPPVLAGLLTRLSCLPDVDAAVRHQKAIRSNEPLPKFAEFLTFGV